jgi:hypothetical protein
MTSIRDIQAAVCRFYSLPTTAMTDRRRGPGTTATPRHVAMYLARRLTGLSYRAIALHFGGRDHKGVVYADRRIRARQRRDAELRGCVERLTDQLTEDTPWPAQASPTPTFPAAAPTASTAATAADGLPPRTAAVGCACRPPG